MTPRGEPLGGEATLSIDGAPFEHTYTLRCSDVDGVSKKAPVGSAAMERVT